MDGDEGLILDGADVVKAQSRAEQGNTKIKILTTRPSQPFLLSAFRVPRRTRRLLLRPLDALDLSAVNAFRIQASVMKWTSVGTVDEDLDETEIWLNKFLAPNDERTYFFAICLQGTGGLIGAGGCLRFQGTEDGFPEWGYMIREEYWGQGLVTEFAEEFLRAWWELPRSDVEIEVPQSCVATICLLEPTTDQNSSRCTQAAIECLLAATVSTNVASRRILDKCGFKEWATQHVPDRNDSNRTIAMVKYLLQRP